MKISDIICEFQRIRGVTKKPTDFEKLGHAVFKKYLKSYGDRDVIEVYDNLDELYEWMKEEISESTIVNYSRHLIKILDLDIVKTIIPEEKRNEYTNIITALLRPIEKTYNRMRTEEKKKNKLVPATVDQVPKKEEVPVEDIKKDDKKTVGDIVCKQAHVTKEIDVDLSKTNEELKKQLELCEEKLKMTVAYKDEIIVMLKDEVAFWRSKHENKV